MKFYNRYNRPPEVKTVLDYDTKFVDQSEADMVGLHYQLQRYGLDGLAARFEAMKDKFGYADTRLVPSFAELQNRIIKGTEYFRNLPSEIRAKFGHSPVKFYEFLESNPEEAVRQGFVKSDSVSDLLRNVKEDKNSDVNGSNLSVDKTSPDVNSQDVSSEGGNVSAD